MATLTLRPNGKKAAWTGQQAWTASSGTDKFDMVDEVVSDDDTTYIYETTSGGQYQVVELEDTGLTDETINSVTLHVVARRTGSGGQLGLIFYPNPANEFSRFEVSSPFIAASYTEYTGQYAENPATTAAWTVSEVNDLCVGVLCRWLASDEMRVTQIWVVVDYTVGGGISIPVAMNHLNTHINNKIKGG